MFLPWVHLGRRTRPLVYLRKIQGQIACFSVPRVRGVVFVGWSARCRNAPWPMRIAMCAACCALEHRKNNNGVLAKNGRFPEQIPLHAQPRSVFHWMGPQVRVESRLCNHLLLALMVPAINGLSRGPFITLCCTNGQEHTRRLAGGDAQQCFVCTSYDSKKVAANVTLVTFL
jgi:hypothetical protein